MNRLTLRWIPLENTFSFLQAKCTELEAYSAVLEDERARVESEGKAKGEEHLKVIQSLQTELKHTANNLQLLTDAKMQLEVVCGGCVVNVFVCMHVTVHTCGHRCVFIFRHMYNIYSYVVHICHNCSYLYLHSICMHIQVFRHLGSCSF